MILKSPKSRLLAVNLFADFILSKIPKEHQTVIQVVDCSNFYVIKGKTSYDELLNISELIDEFQKKYESYLPEITDGKKLSHTIDLIEYNKEIPKTKNILFTYHNTENCSYNYIQSNAYLTDNTKSYDYNYNLIEIEDNTYLTYSSEFPHGYSLSQGRLLYYYGKYIMYNVPPSYYIHNLTMNIPSDNPEENFECDNDGLTSPILDMFDFDMSWLEKEMKKVDWCYELTNPLEEHGVLKTRVKDFII
jgi:hypothetical protein